MASFGFPVRLKVRRSPVESHQFVFLNMSATSSDNEAAMLVPEVKVDVLSPPLEGGRNARSAKRKLSFDGASSKTIDYSSPRGDRTPSPFGATCPGRKETCGPPVSLLTGHSSQQFGHPPPESKGTSSLAELFPQFVIPEKKFMEAMAMDGRTVLHASPRHVPASPFFLIYGAGVESSKGNTNTLEDEFEFLDWYIVPDPVWWVSLLPLPNNVEDRVGRDWFLPVIHWESKLMPEVALIQPHYDDCREILSHYVSGRQPTTGSLAWKDAE
ncbi:hypothetical protein C2S51_028226 [Perilla frutescens var. frutescens]|nr:hypothetical protein C2S51_028226 [Perilla frutescens var. frutescens]